jgi:hypothetical protein
MWYYTNLSWLQAETYYLSLCSAPSWGEYENYLLQPYYILVYVCMYTYIHAYYIYMYMYIYIYIYIYIIFTQATRFADMQFQANTQQSSFTMKLKCNKTCTSIQISKKIKQEKQQPSFYSSCSTFSEPPTAWLLFHKIHSVTHMQDKLKVLIFADLSYVGIKTRCNKFLAMCSLFEVYNYVINRMWPNIQRTRFCAEYFPVTCSVILTSLAEAIICHRKCFCWHYFLF